MKKPILLPDQSLTFADYFKLELIAEDVAEYFGYVHQRQDLILPQFAGEAADLTALKETLERSLLKTELGSEIGIREFLIAPVLLKLLELTETKIRTEYALEVNHQLRGTIDYLLTSKNRLVVVEAKNGDLKRGFSQLAAGLIAFDRAGESEQKILYGAVSVGEVWRFGKLDRAEKQIFEDLNLFLVPRDLPNLIKVLIGILENEN